MKFDYLHLYDLKKEPRFRMALSYFFMILTLDKNPSEDRLHRLL